MPHVCGKHNGKLTFQNLWQELFSAVEGGGAYITVDNGTPTKIKPSAVDHMTNACIVSGQEQKHDFFFDLFFYDKRMYRFRLGLKPAPDKC